MRPRPSRLAPLLAAALLAATGCFLGEIDKSMARYEGNKKPAAGGGAPAKAAPGAAPAPGAPAGPSWWQTARTLGSEPMDASIAGCRLGGRVEFMRRDDCLARGGEVD